MFIRINPETEAIINISVFVPFTVHSSTAIPTINVTVKIDNSIIHSDLPKSYEPVPLNFSKKRVTRKYKNLVKNKTNSLATPFPVIRSPTFSDKTFPRSIRTVVFMRIIVIPFMNTTKTFLYIFPLRKNILYAISIISIVATDNISTSVNSGHTVIFANSRKAHTAASGILSSSFLAPRQRVKNSAIITHSTILAAISATIILSHSLILSLSRQLLQLQLHILGSASA